MLAGGELDAELSERCSHVPECSAADAAVRHREREGRGHAREGGTAHGLRSAAARPREAVCAAREAGGGVRGSDRKTRRAEERP